MNRRTTAVAGSLAAGFVALMLAGLSTVAQAADPIPGAGTTVGTVADPASGRVQWSQGYRPRLRGTRP